MSKSRSVESAEWWSRKVREFTLRPDRMFVVTMCLPPDAAGVFFKIVLRCLSENGPFGYDDKEAARFAGCSVRKWVKIRDLLFRFGVMKQVDGGIIPRIADEMLDEHMRKHRPEPGAWAVLREAAFERDGWTCRYCGKKGSRLECDHVIPVSQGGRHVMENLATACAKCNRDKSGQTPEQWGRALMPVPSA